MVEINNLTTNAVDDKFLEKVAGLVVKGEKLANSFVAGRAGKGVDISIALVGQGRIRELNKKYRKKNKVTDVLAFPESKVLLEKFKAGPIEKTQGLGEIVICLREVRKNAKKFGLPFEKEMARVLIHGILHLLGYDHEKSKVEAERMQKQEEYYLTRLSH